MLLAGLLAGACLHAEPVEVDHQGDLYRDAMHSMAEGRASDASAALTRMIEQEPQHAGAWLDLAIIQCELGRAAEAERMFRLIEERFAPPPGIREVIASYRERGCKGWQAKDRLTVTLGRGADSNVNQGTTNPYVSFRIDGRWYEAPLAEESLRQRDQYTLLSAEYLRELGPDGTTGFAQLHARQNDSLSRYDTASVRFGVEHPWRIGEWGMLGTGALGWLTLGSELYQKHVQLQLRAAPPLALPAGLRLNLLGGVTRAQYVTLTNFDATTMEASGSLAYQGTQSNIQANAGYLWDHGAPNRPGGDRRGWFVGLQGNRYLAHDIIGELGWTRQRWLGETIYFPSLSDLARHQDTQLWRASLIVPIKPHHTLNIEWRKVRNAENIALFQYNSQLLQVSWQWQLF